MPDDPDPPRKFYGFRPREFERANEPQADVPAADAPLPDPGMPSADAGRIDVRELIRAGAGDGPQLGANAVVNRDNEIHAVLRANFERDKEVGHYDLGKLDDSKRRRRIRNYCLLLAAVDAPLGVYAVWMGPGAAIPFVSAIAGIGLFTAFLTWETFFLRTHY